MTNTWVPIQYAVIMWALTVESGMNVSDVDMLFDNLKILGYEDSFKASIGELQQY